MAQSVECRWRFCSCDASTQLLILQLQAILKQEPQLSDKKTDHFVFMSQVKVYNIDEHKHSPDDVLVMGTDGLWDVTTDREVADAVSAYLSCCDPSDPMRYAACQIIPHFLFSQYVQSHVISIH